MKKIITEPLVSVVVRTCNRPFLLKRALTSIINQKYPALEIVVVDDGAYKVNPSFLNSKNKNCKIKYLKTCQKGRSFAANRGIDAANGEFVIFLDDDDELYPDHVRVMINSLLEGKTIVYSDCELSFEDYDIKSDSLTIEKQYVRFSNKFNQGLLFVRNYIPLMCLCFPKFLLKEIDGFDETIDLYEDWDLLLRLSFKIDFHHVPQVTAKYRFWSKGQITAKANSDTKADYYKIASKYMERLTPHNLYEIFLYSEDNYNKIAEFNEGQNLLSGYKNDISELTSANAQLKEKIDQLEQQLEATNNELEATNNKLVANENKLTQIIKDTKRLSIEKDELLAIHRLYVAENIKKDEYIIILQHDLVKETSGTADTKEIQDTP